MTSIARSAFWGNGRVGMRSVVGSSNLRVAGRVFRGGEANAANYWRCGRGAIARFQSGASVSPSQSSTTSPSSSTAPIPPSAQQPLASNSSSQSQNRSQSQSNQQPKSPRGPITRTLLFLLTSTLCFTAGFTMSAAPILNTAVSTATAALEPPTDADTLIMFTPSSETAREIETQIFEHPLTQSLLKDPKYIASRPHLKIPEHLRPQNLTGGTLLGDDKIAVPPLQFTTEDGSSFASLQFLGSALCGHPGIVHGGLLATLLDEGLARCCFPALPNKIAVTASLKIDYKKPTMANQVVVLRAETTKVEGRKAWVKGRLETLVDESKGETPVVLVEAEALFVEPRGAENMKRAVPT